MSPVKELRWMARKGLVVQGERRRISRNAAKYIKSLEGVLSDLVSADIKTLGEVNRLRFELEATQTANKLLIDRDTKAHERIAFLERMSLDMDKELKQSREDYAILEASKKLIQDRWDKLMERRDLQARRP